MAIFIFESGVSTIANGIAVIKPSDKTPGSYNYILDMPGRTVHDPGVNASGSLDARYRIHASGWSGMLNQ